VALPPGNRAERVSEGAGVPATPAVLGVDLGTTEAKAGLIGLDGTLLGMGRGTYPMDLGPDGRAEQSPTDWWAAVGAAARAALAGRSRARVLGVCGVGQGPTLAVVDAEAHPVRPAITWQDRRAGDGGFGLLPRMAWLATNEPGSIERARWLLTSWDALGLWLSGEAATTLQGHETALDPGSLEAAGVDPSRVPEALPIGARLGTLRPAAAAAMGLEPGIPVIAGVNDGTASILGAGLRVVGDAVDTGGTSGGLGIYAAAPISLPGVFSAPAPIPGRWVVGGAMAALGASLEWLRSHALAASVAIDDLLREAARVSPGAGGLLFLPYLAGERAPVFDEAARGAFVGLTLGHGRAHLARAVLEGAAFALRHVATPIADAGAPIRELWLAGRATPGDAWARIKADALGLPVAIPSIGETSVVGAAILAAAGIGAVPGLEQGVATMTSVARRIEPDPGARATYDAAFAVYADLYRALAPTMHALSELSAGEW
jgi:sugar (pentulose or hexulose) kinase